jgi:hypothetical protein
VEFVLLAYPVLDTPPLPGDVDADGSSGVDLDADPEG